jgi:hypothetical protein
LRFCGRDAPLVVGDDPIWLNAVFFPLLATLLRLWHSRIEEKYAYKNSNSTTTTTTNSSSSTKQQQQQQSNNNIKKVLILVSGVGIP